MKFIILLVVFGFSGVSLAGDIVGESFFGLEISVRDGGSRQILNMVLEPGKELNLEMGYNKTQINELTRRVESGFVTNVELTEGDFVGTIITAVCFPSVDGVDLSLKLVDTKEEGRVRTMDSTLNIELGQQVVFAESADDYIVEVTVVEL